MHALKVVKRLAKATCTAEPVVVANWIALIAVLATLPGIFLQWPCASGFAPWLIRSAFFCVCLPMACVLTTKNELWRHKFSNTAMWANTVLHACIAAQWCFGSIAWLACFLPALAGKFCCMKVLLGRGNAPPYWMMASGVPLAYYIGHTHADVAPSLSADMYKPFLQAAAASSSLLVTAIALTSQYPLFLARSRPPSMDSASWLPIAIGRAIPVVPEETAVPKSMTEDSTEDSLEDVGEEANNVRWHDYDQRLDVPVPGAQAPDDWLQVLEAMRERSLARDDPVAAAVVTWLDQHDPRAQIEALAQDRREASLRYWHRRFHRDAPFYLYALSRRRRTINEILKRMLRLKRNHVDWKRARNLSKQDAANLDLLAQTRLSGRPLEVIAACLEPDTDVWSTGSVTQAWALLHGNIRRGEEGYE
eukprot:TRINITY_DN5576_c0_g2_i1.p1 TRINITY_DN5576_c0_g2~~TRINITY_DN5576_c0_g2_i1.p1  ORF type:complete len:436 (+),score=41.37 TRINITY_DN5576_c0_g2_i1:51-1310(+)